MVHGDFWFTDRPFTVDLVGGRKVISFGKLSIRPLGGFLCLYRGLGHRGDDALLHEDARLGAVLEGLLGHPFGTDGQAEGAFVLLPGLEGVGELRGEEAVVLGGGRLVIWILEGWNRGRV